MLLTPILGSGKQEDVVEMMEKYPYMNEYWADKRADMSRIEVPSFVGATYASPLHTVGSLRGYQEIPHDKKWYGGCQITNPNSCTLLTS